MDPYETEMYRVNRTMPSRGAGSWREAIRNNNPICIECLDIIFINNPRAEMPWYIAL